MRSAISLLAIVVLAGCGTSPTKDAKPGYRPAAPPASPPSPTSAPNPNQKLPGGSSRPPAAWLETERGSVWLGLSSYCWGNFCGDFTDPACDDSKFTPKITLRRGEVVTAHLEFDPTDLDLSYYSRVRGPPARDQQTLALRRAPSWTVERGGPFSLFTRAKGGDVSYVGCAVFEVVVPKLIGMAYRPARELLARRGLRWGFIGTKHVWSKPPPANTWSTGDDDLITEQAPAAETMVAPGSVVRLRTSCTMEPLPPGAVCID